jgi:hypothetical protein
MSTENNPLERYMAVPGATTSLPVSAGNPITINLTPEGTAAARAWLPPRCGILPASPCCSRQAGPIPHKSRLSHPQCSSAPGRPVIQLPTRTAAPSTTTGTISVRIPITTHSNLTTCSLPAPCSSAATWARDLRGPRPRRGRYLLLN